MRTKKKQKKSVVFLLLFVFLIATVALVWRYFNPDRTKSEGSETKIFSDGSKTDVILSDTSKEEVKISTASANHNQPFSRGDFIVWVEEAQGKSEKHIVRYHVPTKTTYYITTTGVAQSPKVNTEGQVVWQEWTNETWQIFYFDATQVQQISTEQTSCINPDISGRTIVYAKKDAKNVWQTIRYSVESKTFEVIKEGIEAKHPSFYGTKLFFQE